MPTRQLLPSSHPASLAHLAAHPQTVESCPLQLPQNTSKLLSAILRADGIERASALLGSPGISLALVFANEPTNECQQTLHRGTSMSITGIPSSTFNQYPLDAVSKLFQRNFKHRPGSRVWEPVRRETGFLHSAKGFPNAGRLHTTRCSHNHILRAGAGDLANQNSLLQELDHLSQTLDSGSLSAAPQAYVALQTQSTVSTIGGHHTEPPVTEPLLSTLA
jgi:hypothetical protein